MEVIILFVILLCSNANAEIVKQQSNGALSKSASDSAYVNVAGDTMTGPLTLSGSSLTVTGAGEVRGNFQTTGTNYFSPGAINQFYGSGKTWTFYNVGAGVATINAQDDSATKAMMQFNVVSAGNFSADFPQPRFSVGGSTLVVSGGKVGVGTASPVAKLDLAGGRAYFRSQAEPYAIGVGRSEHNDIYLIGASLDSPTDLVFSNQSGTERMRLTSGGNVGINTTTPQQKLSVSSGTIHMAGTGTPAVGAALCLTAGGVMGVCTGGTFTACTCTAP